MTSSLGAIAPVFPVRSIRDAIAWYRDVLGLEPAYVNADAAASPVYAVLARDGVALHLQAAAYTFGRGSAVIHVRGVDALFGRCRTRGATICRPLEDSPYGLRDFVMRDPDGNTLLIGESRAERRAEEGSGG